MALSHGELLRVEDASPTLSQSIFPFMSLPAEIRLMIYDAAMPDKLEVYLGTSRPQGLPPVVRGFMAIKVIRNEFLPHLFSRYCFIWINSSREPIDNGTARVWHCFKRHAIPFITSIRIHHAKPFSGYRYCCPPFRGLLKWMRWRSMRSHLYPWHLKRLQLYEINVPYWYYRQTTLLPEASDFPNGAPTVPGLESLTIILRGKPSDQAVKTFLERCARNGTRGKIGDFQWGTGKPTEWVCLQDDQIVRMSGCANCQHLTCEGCKRK